MKKVPANKTVEAYTHYSIKNTRLDIVVHEDDVMLVLNKAQYDRIRESFDTCMFKKMNDDAKLADLYEMYDGKLKTCDNEIYLFDYPLAVTKGQSFDELYKIQNSKLSRELEREIDAIVDDAIAKSEKIWDRLSGDIEEVDARLDAIDELNVWMAERGFDEGELNTNLVDDEGFCIECLDIGWRYGVCPGKGYFKPVAVQFYHTTDEQLRLAKEQGFEFFLSIEEFKLFIEKSCLGGKI